MDVIEFRDRIMNYIMKIYPDSSEYRYSKEDIQGIEKLRDEKFSTWDWNFGYSPKYDFEKMIRTEGGSVEFHFNVEKGIIRDIRIYGDFFHRYDIEDVTKALIGVKHEYDSILEKLSEFNFNDYFKNIKPQEFIMGMF
jgi:lipoate-protein ligase A